jgi:hypothetical protein
MPIHEFKQTEVFQQVTDSIDLARELSIELEMRPIPPTEEDIFDAVYIMNQHLEGVTGQVPALITANEAYLDLPADVSDAAFISSAAIEKTRIEQATMRGRIERFHWFGSTVLTAFGVQLYGTELITPHRKFYSSAFVPVEAISLHLAAK